MDKRAPAAAAGLLALLAVVAATSHTRLFHEGEPPLSTATSHLLVDFAAYLFLTVLLLSCALAVWALWPRDGYDGPEPKRRSIWQTLIQVAILSAAMVVLFAAVALRRQLAGQQPGRSQAGGVFAPPPGLISGTGNAAPAGFDWAAAGLVVLTLLVVAAVFWRSWRRRRARTAERQALARDLAAVVEDSLDDLRLDDDPRRAVVQAYARMERVLAVHRLPRRPAEAPHEYVRRALRELPLTPQAVGRLTELFEEARFSTHTISGGMRADAVDALARIRDELVTAPAPAPTSILNAAG